MPASVRRRTLTLAIDPILCDGYGICGELFSEWIRPDDWGYPIIRQDEIPPELLARARWAVSNCPALALSLRRANIA
jgi:ferredoxin